MRMRTSSSLLSSLVKGALPLLPVLSVLSFSGSVHGYGYFDALGFGNTVNSVSVRSAALAGIRVFGAEGPSALFMNPATLSEVDRFQSSLSVSSIAWAEEVVDTTHTTLRSGSGLGALTGATGLRVDDDIVVAMGVAMVADHQYDGTHYLPEDPSQPGVDRVEILRASGGLWEALGGVSWEFAEGFSAGLSGGLRFGGVDYDYSYDDYSFPGVDSVSSWSWELSEPCFHAGITARDDLMGAGASFTSGSEHYHSRISIAGRARAEHIGNVTMGFEGDVVDPFGGNYFTGKLSLETPIRQLINLFSGVGFYEGTNMNRVGLVFSVGGNITVGGFRVECALFHSGRSRKSTSFPEEYADYVDDSWTQFSLGIDYGLSLP